MSASQRFKFRNPTPPLSKLPLKSLVLYENGVGYFERRGPVPAGAVAEIPLEAGQLDDALKSLVVVSDRGVASVEFAPPLAAEAARAMAGMPGLGEQRSILNLVRVVENIPAEQLSSMRVAELLARATADEVKATLVALKAELEKSESAAAQVKRHDERIRALEQDLGRIRENLAAVSKSAAAGDTAKQLGERLLKLEDELKAARRDREAAAKTAETIRRTLLAKR